MRIETGHLILLSILLLCPLVHSDLRAQEKTPVTRADSIMRQVIHQAPIYEHVLESYEAETYVKGRTHVPRKNKLLRYAYLVFPIERHPRDAFFEMSGLTRYDAPNHYRNEIVAINSSHLAAGRHYKEIASFVNLNVYSPTIYNKGMICHSRPMLSNITRFGRKARTRSPASLCITSVSPLANGARNYYPETCT